MTAGSDPTKPSRRQGDTTLDQRMMLRAVSLARRGEGRVEPNPMVGCVIARSGRIIAEGHHRRFGGPHAEIVALSKCTTSPRGATAYVTLEPCGHFGKTPPCCDALIAAGIARVVVALRDPNPEVNGRGLRRLRKAGIAVEVGVCADQAADVLVPFLTCQRLKRPYVIAKWAQSLDGRMATKTGDSKWISCAASRRQVHRIRGRVDGIVVGSGTAIADDPRLTARDVAVRRVACRVVLDARLRTPPASRLVATASEAPTLILTTGKRSKSTKAARFARLGVEVVACRTRSGRLSPQDCLAKLHARGMTNLLVEGGPAVLTSFLFAELVDEAFVFVAPKLLGGAGGYGAIGDLGIRRVAEAISGPSCTIRRYGVDTLYRMRLQAIPLR